MISREHGLLVVAAAFLVSWALCALLVRQRTFFIDVPNERSLHAQPIPRTGGIAISTAALTVSALLPGTGVLVGCAAVVALVSLLDDFRPMPASARLAVHLAAAATFAVLQLHAGVFTSLLVVLALAWACNLYNFMDGSDGLAGGMGAFGFGTYALGAAWSGSWVLATFSAAIAAAAVGFLLYNFHPARLFMGDAGSVTLGFLAGAIGVLGWRVGAWPLAFPALAFWPFIADASVTLARRVMRGEKFWKPHREHYYQKLVRLGLGHRRTALVEYAAMAASGLCALAVMDASTAAQAAALLVWIALSAVAAVTIDRRWSRHSAGASA